MKISSENIISTLKTKKYNDIYVMIDEMIENGYHVNIINAILFLDDDVALEYLIATHRKIFIEWLDYIQKQSFDVYFSDKCINVLENLKEKEYLFI